MRNHGSMGLLGSWILVGNLALVVLAFPFLFPFLLFGAEREQTQRFGFITKQVIASRIPQVLTKLLLLFSFFFCF